MSTFQELKASFRRRLLTVANSHLLGPLETSLTGYEEEIGRRRRLLDLLRRTVCPADIRQEETGGDGGGDGGGGGRLDFQRSELRKHWRGSKPRKTERAPLCCSLCGKRFTQAVGLNYHLKIHSGEKPFSCSVCGKRFRKKEHVKHHTLTHSGLRPFSCSVCSRTFRWPTQLKIHKCVTEATQRHREKPKKPLSCSECGEMFPDRSLLTAHRKSHVTAKRFTCSVCGLQRQFRSQMKLHMRTHTGEKPYSCSVCGRKFSRQAMLTQHMVVHTKVKPFSCFDCGKRFAFNFLINKHKCLAKAWPTGQRSKPDKETPASVESDADSQFWRATRQHWSGVTYQRNKNMDGHGVTADTRAEAELRNNGGADSEVSRQTQLLWSRSNHQRTEDASVRSTGSHSDRKPLSCSFCGKGFPTAGSLTRHMSAHTGEKPLSCFVCEETFLLEAALLSHRCVGESLIPANTLFSCSVCADRFATREGLHLHLRHHTSCSVCNASFSNRDVLLQHMRSHMTQTQFHCSLCGKDFTWRRHLTRHMELHQAGSSDTESRLRPELGDQAANALDTDDSDFWKEGGKCPSESKVKQEEEEADITELLPFSCVPVKSEDDDEVQSSQLHHIRDSLGAQDCGGPGTGPGVRAVSCKSDDSVDSDFWKDDRRPPSV